MLPYSADLEIYVCPALDLFPQFSAIEVFPQITSLSQEVFLKLSGKGGKAALGKAG